VPIPRFPFSSAGATARFAAALGSAWLLVACGGSSTTLGDPSAGGTSGVGGSGASVAGGVDSLAGASSSPQAGATSGGGGAANSGGCNQPTITTPTPCNGHYPATTVSTLRNAKASGCFELSDVGLVARTDSPSEPRIYLQDPGGGDTSAILAKCTASATHACAPEVKAKVPLLFDTLTDGAQLSVRGYYQFGGVTGFEEFYIEDIIDECKTVARPAPIALSLSDLTRDARAPAKWFRRAMLDIPATDPLVVYDFSPPELLLGAAQCPDYAGFAMIQHSLGALPPAACSGTTNPAPRTTADPKEVLIGRQFFNQFLFGADCACAGQTHLQIVKPTAAVSGSVLGYLILEQDKASPTAYQVFEPAADQTFPIR
jgi:hypothetical protein